MPAEEMMLEEVERFLTCARVGRLGMYIGNQVHIYPVGYVYSDGKIFFHTCKKGLKMTGIQNNNNVCFEVDECTSDVSMYSSVIVFGTVNIVDDKVKMVSYMQALINKYRVPEPFDLYMKKRGRSINKELQASCIWLITPKKITGRRYVKDKIEI
jgi:nitroimidazol reductase NimA-like FMN-containing flavoprotein (pyridoxamine 5'-phosphate oxidase superfamily)